MNPVWRDALESARDEWSINPRLRLWALVVVAVLWLYALLLAGEWAEQRSSRNAALAVDVARMQPTAFDREWPSRAERAQQQLLALQAMRWTDAELGVVEAAWQDWLRATAARAGLSVTSLTVTRAAQTPGAKAQPALGQVIRARLTVDLQRMPLIGFLSEVAHHERVIVVERLHLRTRSQPPSAEIELRIVASTPVNAP